MFPKFEDRRRFVAAVNIEEKRWEMVRCNNACYFAAVLGFCLLCMVFYFEPFATQTAVTAAEKAKNTRFNESRVSEIFSDLCRLYRAGQVSGDFCNRLCYYNSLDFVDFFQSSKVNCQLEIVLYYD